MAQNTMFEWAWKLWSLLAFAAQTQTILSYDMVEELTGLAAVGVGNRGLGPIAAYCMDNDLPALTSIVVEIETGLPADGLLKLIPKEDIPTEQHKVFVCHWGRKPKPSVEQLEAAYNKVFPKSA